MLYIIAFSLWHSGQVKRITYPDRVPMTEGFTEFFIMVYIDLVFFGIPGPIRFFTPLSWRGVSFREFRDSSLSLKARKASCVPGFFRHSSYWRSEVIEECMDPSRIYPGTASPKREQDAGKNPPSHRMEGMTPTRTSGPFKVIMMSSTPYGCRSAESCLQGCAARFISQR